MNKIKPKDIKVNLPAVHLFQSEDEMAQMASAINTILHGDSKIKFEALGLLGGQYVGLFYIKRNNESQQIHDEFMRLIEQEEIKDQLMEEETEVENLIPAPQHHLCVGCEDQMLHLKELEHCICGADWQKGQCQETEEWEE